MLIRRCVFMALVISGIAARVIYPTEGQPHRILLDTDVDTDDLFALLYLLKLNRSEFDLQVNAFSKMCYFDGLSFMRGRRCGWFCDVYLELKGLLTCLFRSVI